MGKGYNNFMSKKTFHPGSNANQERVREAEARSLAKKKHDEETLAQYMKEQELFHQKSLISKESKEKLSLSFMYDLPPGVAKKEGEKSSDKVEWTGSNGKSKPIDGNTLTKSSTSKTNDTGLCLEWKRDKPVKNSNQHKKIIEAKQQPVIKKEEQTDIRSSGGVKLEDNKTHIKVECKIEKRFNEDRKSSRDSKSDSKRFKREEQT